jgi:hypothetical protein
MILGINNFHMSTKERFQISYSDDMELYSIHTKVWFLFSFPKAKEKETHVHAVENISVI